MPKKDVLKIVLLTLVLSVGVNLFFGRYLAVKLSTWPLLNKWKILSPQAPIVLTSREVVRVSESGDILEVVSNTKPKLSSVLLRSENNIQVLGGAVNFTSDGLFVTTKSVVGTQPAEQLLIKLNDGTVGAVLSANPDPVTNLVILKTDLKNVSVASFGDSKQLQVGEKILFLTSSSQNHSANFVQTSVYSSQQDVFNKILHSDTPTRVFGAQAAGSLIPGQAVVDLDGQVVGVWDGGSIVSSDVLRHLSGLYLNGNQRIVRPSYGFWYRTITAMESKLLSLPQGARVEKGLRGEPAVAAGSPASKAGLVEGDIVTQVGEDRITEGTLLEEVMQRYKPGDKIQLTVLRGKDTSKLELIVGEIK